MISIAMFAQIDFNLFIRDIGNYSRNYTDDHVIDMKAMMSRKNAIGEISSWTMVETPILLLLAVIVTSSTMTFTGLIFPHQRRWKINKEIEKRNRKIMKQQEKAMKAWEKEEKKIRKEQKKWTKKGN